MPAIAVVAAAAVYSAIPNLVILVIEINQIIIVFINFVVVWKKLEWYQDVTQKYGHLNFTE